MINLLKDFRFEVEQYKSFLSYEKKQKDLIDNLKLKINFGTKMKEIDELTRNNNFF